MVVNFVEKPVRKQRPEKYMIASSEICPKFSLGFDSIMKLVSLL